VREAALSPDRGDSTARCRAVGGLTPTAVSGSLLRDWLRRTSSLDPQPIGLFRDPSSPSGCQRLLRAR
jgi:hypothetical protein